MLQLDINNFLDDKLKIGDCPINESSYVTVQLRPRKVQISIEGISESPETVMIDYGLTGVDILKFISQSKGR